MYKNTSFKLSDQVKQILHTKGLSKIFNYSDFEYFKNNIGNAFDKANIIADLFIIENQTITSDYQDYIF